MCGRHLSARQHINPKNDIRCHACGFERPFLFVLEQVLYSESYVEINMLYTSIR